jgi:nucleotide-binding universal stress UspA family protein
LRIGHPALEILEEAGAFGARLITMSSRGLSALDRIAMGSVAERVIQGAKCPVLVTGRNPG